MGQKAIPSIEEVWAEEDISMVNGQFPTFTVWTDGVGWRGME